MKHIKFKFFGILAAGLLFLGTSACNNNPDSTKDTESNSRMEHEQMAKRKDDSTFVFKAGGINMEEIQMGQLAQDQATSDVVKNLADMLKADHSQLNQKLKEIAANKSIPLPSDLSDDAQDKYNDLKELSGIDFDKKYADMMVDGHKNAIDLFEKDSAKSEDADIREYANRALPILRKHLAEAKNCKDAVKDMD